MLDTAVQQSLSHGKPLVITPATEGRGLSHLVLAADAATPDGINEILHHTTSLLAVAVPGSRLDALQIPCPPAAGHPYSLLFDARQGVTTGISARDRWETIRLLVEPDTRPDQLTCPGHIFAIRCPDDGLEVRPSTPELALALVQLAGRRPAAVLAPMLTADGRAAAPGEATQVANRRGLPMVSGDDVLREALTRWPPVALAGGPELEPTPYGDLVRHVFHDRRAGATFTALTRGDLAGPRPVSVRAHVERHHDSADPGWHWRDLRQLRRSLRQTARAGAAVLLHVELDGPAECPIRLASGCAHVLETLGVRHPAWLGPEELRPFRPITRCSGG